MTMKKYAFFVVILLNVLIPAQSGAQWTTAALSQARHHAFPLVVGHKVLFIGGQAAGGVASNVVDIYDDSTGMWSVHLLNEGAENLAGRNASIAIGSKAIVAAGSISLYDAEKDLWTPIPGFNPRSYMSGGAVGQYAVLAGGSGPEGVSDAVDIYNTASDTWSAATLSEPRILATVASIGNRLFIAGGIKANNVKSDRVDIWDTETNTWTTATLSYPRGMITAVTVGDKVVFGGGSEFDYVWYNQVDVYDHTSGTWSSGALQQYSFGGMLKGLAVNGKAYFGDGNDLPNSSNASNFLDVYDPATNAWAKVTLPAGHIGYNLTSRGPNIFVAGGINAPGNARVDQYHTPTKTWQLVGYLGQPRYYMAAASVGKTVLFAGGLQISGGRTDRVDIYTDPTWTDVANAVQTTPLPVFPNPTPGVVTIQIPERPAQLVVADEVGRIYLEQFDPPAGAFHLDVSAWPKGVYVAQVLCAQGRYVAKIVRSGD